MNTLANLPWQDHAADAAGAFAMLCLMFWPLFRGRAAVLLVQVGMGLGFTVQDALLGSRTGAAMSALGTAFTAAAIPIDRWPRLRLACYAFLPLIGFGAVASWQGPASWLPTLGQLLVTLGRLQIDERRLRWLVLAASPFWIAHGMAIGSLPKIAGNGVSMITGLLMLRRSRDQTPWHERMLRTVRSLLPTADRGSRRQSALPDCAAAAAHC